MLRRLSSWAFWLWAPLCLLLVASLMVTHTYALPAPAPQDLRVERDAQGRWQMLHVLYGRCRCSQRILQHLLTRKALPGVAERIVLVGADPQLEQRARAAGFVIEAITPEELPRRYALNAVPALAVISPARVEYLGGYTERKQGPEIADLEIFERVRAGTRTDALPLFGCAVSEALRGRLDPLSLRAWLLGETR
ncbi:MAG TPA: hypothetical protein VFX59_05820 [Polyangiales bacterium]|nr:hypothetical protein [Polyangiales bacterium]